MRRMGTPEDIAHAVLVPRLGLCLLDHRPDPARDGIARRLRRNRGAAHDRTEAARALAMAGGALAQARRPGAGRPHLPARHHGRAARAAPSRCRSIRDHETNELRDGGKSIGRMAWGQYGNRVGVPRILEMLKRHDVKATFYVPAVAALLHPDEQRRVIAEGHEIGIHGWIHELNSVLPYEAERDLHDARRRHAGEDHRRARRSACARRPGISARTRCAIDEGDGAALRLLADGRRGLLRAAARRRADRRSSSCRSSGSATTRSIS